jgi:glycosyltransferase involved in cell wall biosynthesis
MSKSVLVIIPCYNHGKYLAESVTSILNQSHTNLKVCIVNDGSTDDTHVIATELLDLDDRVSYINLEDNVGKWYCLNVAIESSDCDIITSQDADDVALPDRIERQLLCMIHTSTVHNLCGFYHCYSEDDVKKHKDIRMKDDIDTIKPDDVSKLVSAGWTHPGINHYYTGEFETAGASAMFYRNIWELGLRFLPPEAGLRVLCSEDSDFNFRATAMLGHTSILKEKLYCYRRDTSTNNEKK